MIPAASRIAARPVLMLATLAQLHYGVDAQTLCTAAGITSMQPDDHPDGIPMDAAAALWQQLERMTQDPLVGLRLAQEVPLGVLGFVYHSLHVSDTLRDALHRASRYTRLLSSVLELTLVETAAASHLRVRIRPGYPEAPGLFLEYTLLLALRNGQHITQTQWRPTRVNFRHATHAPRDAHQALFDCPVHFEQPHTELVLPRELLDLTVPTADATIRTLLDREADAQIHSAEQADGLFSRLRVRIEHSLEHGEPSLQRIANDLKCSPRSLQRWLAREGKAFSSVVDDIRKARASRLMQQSALGIPEIAFLLGFSDTSAFHRAFRRWTGTSPGEYRRRQ